MIQNSTKITIGSCIYCGGPGENTEHTIPYALNGKHELRKACCFTCQKLTNDCENKQLNLIWAPARAALRYDSRHRDWSRETFPVKATLKDGTIVTLSLNAYELSAFTSFLEYPLPGFLAASSNVRPGCQVIGARLISFGVNPNVTAEKYNLLSIEFTDTYNGTDYARLIGKMSYCAAVQHFGLRNINEKLIVPALLKQKDDICYWVGCASDQSKFPNIIGRDSGDGVCIKIGLLEREKTYILVQSRLFASAEVPEYLAVVGTLKT